MLEPGAGGPEIKRLKVILNDPGETGKLTGRRLRAVAEYLLSRVV